MRCVREGCSALALDPKSKRGGWGLNLWVQAGEPWGLVPWGVGSGFKAGRGLDPTVLSRKTGRADSKFPGHFPGLSPDAPPLSQPPLRAWKRTRSLRAQPEGAKDKGLFNWLVLEGSREEAERSLDARGMCWDWQAEPQRRHPESPRPVASHKAGSETWLMEASGFGRLPPGGDFRNCRHSAALQQNFLVNVY